jgi:hypothetical protein
MTRLKRTIRREKEAATAPEGSREAASAERKARFLSTILSNRVIKIDRYAATAPSMKAGAVACEIAVPS